MSIEDGQLREDLTDAMEDDPESMSLALFSDEKRPGLRSRIVEQLARDLLLARDKPPPEPEPPTDPETPVEAEEPVDIGEIQGRRGRAIFFLGAGCSRSA